MFQSDLSSIRFVLNIIGLFNEAVISQNCQLIFVPGTVLFENSYGQAFLKIPQNWVKITVKSIDF